MADDDDTVADDDDVAPDDDDDVPGPALVGLHPPDGTVDHFVHEILWADFDLQAGDPTIMLVDEDGAAVDGAGMWVSNTRFTFDPTDALRYESHYVATISWSGWAEREVHTWEFDTSALSDTPTDADLVGSTFAFDLNDGDVVAPAGGAALLGGFEGLMLGGVVTQTATELDLIVGIDLDGGDPPVQDLCFETIELDEQQPTVWEDPFFLAGPGDIPLSIDLGFGGPSDLLFRDAMVSGIFASSTGGGPVDTISEAALDTILDLRDAGLTCTIASLFIDDLTCIDCPHDPSVAECVAFVIIDMPANLVPGLTLVEVTPQTIENTPDCQ